MSARLPSGWCQHPPENHQLLYSTVPYVITTTNCQLDDDGRGDPDDVKLCPRCAVLEEDYTMNGTKLLLYNMREISILLLALLTVSFQSLHISHAFLSSFPTSKGRSIQGAGTTTSSRPHLIRNAFKKKRQKVVSSTVTNSRHATAASTQHTPVVDNQDNKRTINAKSSLSSFTDKLKDYVNRNDTSPITVIAYVISKRKLGKNLMFVDFQISGGDGNGNDNDVCQAMLRKDVFTGQNYEGYKKCLLKGTKLEIIGQASPTRIPGNVVLLINSMRLVQVPRQQQHIQTVLRQSFIEDNLPKEEVAMACHSSSLIERMKLLPKKFEDQRSEKQWWKQISKDMFQNLPKDPNYPKDADQIEFSKLGNFVRPKAPTEWQHIPKQLEEEKRIRSTTSDDRYQDLSFVSDVLLQDDDDDEKDDDCNTTSISRSISLQGWVQNRRRFDQNITMISLVDEITFVSSSSSDDDPATSDDDQATTKDRNGNRMVAKLHPDLLDDDDDEEGKESLAGLYANVAAVETKVWVSGKLITTNDSGGGTKHKKTIVLWVDQIKLLQSSSRSGTIRHMLDLLHGNQLDVEEVAEALKIPYTDAVAITQQSLDATQRQWKANELAVTLQQSKRDVVKPELLDIMDKYKYLLEEFPIKLDALSDDHNRIHDAKTEPAPNSQAATMMRRMLKKPSIGMPGTKWQNKKRPQLEWMGKQILSVVQSHPDYGKRTLRILDIGGGKGSLANYLGASMEEDNVEILVVDICHGAILNGEKKAKRLKLNNVQFQTADASNLELTSSSLPGAEENQDGSIDVDIVVALHACGHLSDVALGHALYHRAGFVIVPCCFNSNPHLTMPGKFKEEKGSAISVESWLGISPSDWSALKLLAEVQGDFELASKATALICALRSKAVSSCIRSRNKFFAEIRRFPLQYSTRNTVLVGKWSPCECVSSSG